MKIAHKNCIVFLFAVEYTHKVRRTGKGQFLWRRKKEPKERI